MIDIRNKKGQIYGRTGKILRVDLTTGEFKTESSDKYAKRYIGGRGIHQWILFSEVAPSTKPLDPENLLIIGTGPLTGTKAPASSFLAISSKNVYTEGANFSHVGGHFAPQLKFSDFDHVIISGKSKNPVYLWIDNGSVELKDASHLWGRYTGETEDIIRKDHQDENIRVACIGQAGENLVRAAAIIVDKTRAAGGGGIGAVMGSKNLKAIAVRGENEIAIAHPEKFNAAVSNALTKINNSGFVGMSTHMGTRLMNDVCLIPVKNTDDDHWHPDKMNKIDIPAIETFKTGEKITACFNCPIGCGNHVYEVKEGPFAGLKYRLFEASTGYSFGSRFDIDYFPAILKAFESVSQLGLDESNTAVVISWAFDCYEKGIITKEDTGGLELKWGDYEAVIELIHKLAHREGFGGLLADGVKKASDKIGKGSEYYATHVKGQEFTDAIRGAKGWALGIITSTRGGRHLNGAPSTEYYRLPPEIGEMIYGVPTAGDGREYKGKAKLVYRQEQAKAIVDIVGMCFFTSNCFAPILLGPEDYAMLLGAAVGIEYSVEDLMLIGRKINNW